jgi:hypothetical protein
MTLSENTLPNYEHIKQMVNDSFYSTKFIINNDGSVSFLHDALGKIASIWLSSGQLPIKVRNAQGHFKIDDCHLTTLVGGPKNVSGIFECSNNELSSFKGAPETCRKMLARHNQITSLQDVSFSDHIDVRSNKITSLLHCPKALDTLIISDNPVTSLEGLPKQLVHLSVTYSSNLPVLRLINSRAGISFGGNYHHDALSCDKLLRIIYNHQESLMINKNPIKLVLWKCQNELIENGFEDNARW